MQKFKISEYFSPLGHSSTTMDYSLQLDGHVGSTGPLARTSVSPDSLLSIATLVHTRLFRLSLRRLRYRTKSCSHESVVCFDYLHNGRIRSAINRLYPQVLGCFNPTSGLGVRLRLFALLFTFVECFCNSEGLRLYFFMDGFYDIDLGQVRDMVGQQLGRLCGIVLRVAL